jgi:hypothetical protein
MQEFIADLMNEARQDLLTAVKLSRQASYHRRAPSPECLPQYGEARRLLGLVLESEPSHREALMLMAQVSEGLMDFKAAADFLTKAIQAGEPATKKLLKKMAQLRESNRSWNGLVLTPDMLRDLGEYLESMGVGPANRTLDLTREWLLQNFDGDPNEVIIALDRRGAFSDFQVLANVVYG